MDVEGALPLRKLMPRWRGNLIWKIPPLFKILPRTLNRTFLGIWVVCLTPTSHWTSFVEQPHSQFSPMLIWYRLLNIPTTCLVLVYNFVSPYNTRPSIAYFFEISYYSGPGRGSRTFWLLWSQYIGLLWPATHQCTSCGWGRFGHFGMNPN